MATAAGHVRYGPTTNRNSDSRRTGFGMGSVDVRSRYLE
ncbi:MAG: hypothetical protein AVDCRST_MAG78-483 [uncultured Rubrobacteraceae bacterium]|uniref:Uncharacterized protein n=1 Tax=uncultured Rubrobacteraceae bacterium TaxID=349277 RepID=A0A6J4PD97_9ACTN|nr:MAG: hypothetical protein AVDCRST_MAG78-483 [uncultured Rubrobacteraceae bacterium]